MAGFGNNFTDELRQRLSIVDIVGRRVPLVKKGQNFWGCCPFHNEKTPSFSVNEEKGFYHCFGCGEHGDIISFTMKSGNLDFKAAIAELAQMAGLKLPDYKPKSAEQIKKEDTYFSIYENVAKTYCEKLYSPDGAHAMEYLRKRGFDNVTIKKYRLGYAPKSNIVSAKFPNIKADVGLTRVGNYGPYDFFRDRLMFPITNPAGQVVAFSGRSLDGSEPKYMNTGETEMFHKGRTVFGLSFARDAIHKNNRTIVVEGQIDAIQMQTHGFPETVAPLGTALTADHIAILCKLNRNITFCFDGDGAGQKAAARACGLVLPFLRDNSDVRFAFMPNGSDPDDMLRTDGGEKTMADILNRAAPLADFMWTLANTSFLVSTPGGKAQAEKFLKKELEKIEDSNLRAEMSKEYDSRKFNQWHKWKKDKTESAQAAPDVGALTRQTLSAIVEKYPSIAERYGDFVSTLGINLKDAPDTNLSEGDAEKFIVSLKLQKYIEKLNTEKKDATARVLHGDESAKAILTSIESEIEKSRARLCALSGV